MFIVDDGICWISWCVMGVLHGMWILLNLMQSLCKLLNSVAFKYQLRDHLHWHCCLMFELLNVSWHSSMRYWVTAEVALQYM